MGGIRFGKVVSIGISGVSASELCILRSKRKGGRATTCCRNGFGTAMMSKLSMQVTTKDHALELRWGEPFQQATPADSTAAVD